MLISKLTSESVLALYLQLADTEFYTDASASGLGETVIQLQKDSQIHSVFYFSKCITEVEDRYHSYELETLAIVNVLNRFRVYLQGRPFDIFTDYNALK